MYSVRTKGNTKRWPARVSRVADELVSHCWLVDALPRQSTRKQPAENVSQLSLSCIGFLPESQADFALDRNLHESRWPSPRATKWHELRFKPNGFIEKRGDLPFVTWEVKHKKGKWYAIIFDDSHRPVAHFFQRAALTWAGEWIGVKGRIQIRSVERHFYDTGLEYRTGTGELRLTQAGEAVSENTTRRNLRRKFGPILNLANSSHSLSDHICSVYAGVAVARLGIEVVFHTPFAVLLSRVHEKGFVTSGVRPICGHVTPVEELLDRQPLVDLNANYQEMLRYGISRAEWFCRAILPGLKAARDLQVDAAVHVPSFEFGKYIVIAPAPTSAAAEDWPATHWARLVFELYRAGYEVVAMGESRELERFRTLFAGTTVLSYFGGTPEWVIDTLLGATAFIGMAGGFTALAALLSVKTIALHSHSSATFLWDCMSVESVTPNTHCTFCRCQDDRGYVSPCRLGCSALGSISVDTVVRALNKLVNEP